MKNVKKILAMMLALIMVFGLVACGNDDVKETEIPTEPIVTEKPDETVESTEPFVSDGTEVDLSELSNTENVLLAVVDACPVQFPVMTWPVDISDAEALKAFTGLDDAEGIVEVSVTEPVMSSQAYSVVAVKVDETADAKAIAENMKRGVNPAKWICVEADDIDVAVAGDYVLLAMMSTDFADTVTVEKVTSAFVSLIENDGVPTLNENAEGAADAE